MLPCSKEKSSMQHGTKRQEGGEGRRKEWKAARYKGNKFKLKEKRGSRFGVVSDNGKSSKINTVPFIKKTKKREEGSLKETERRNWRKKEGNEQQVKGTSTFATPQRRRKKEKRGRRKRT